MYTNKYINICLWLLLTVLLTSLQLSAQENAARKDSAQYRIVELKADNLPNLNIPRIGHTTLCTNGEMVVFGGHTNGFVPTATAEYFSNGEWHTISLAYTHDHGTVIPLRSGKVFLAGGHKEDLGIGQLFSAEIYDPTTHTSQGFGSMDKKRAYANAIEMKDGQVVIAGNWHNDDGIEMFEDIYDPYRTNAVAIKDVSVPRAMPYILRIADDDAIIFSTLDNINKPIDSSNIDRLKGDSYHEPFLDTWHPIHNLNVHRSYNQFIGNEAKSRYEWLMPVENIETGEVAIARIKGATEDNDNATFYLLQTAPANIKGKKITYSNLICDTKRKIAYLIGDDDKARIYVVAISYDSADKSPMTVYVTDPQPIAAQSTSAVLTSDGDIVFTGGCLYNNFSPSKTVIRLPLGNSDNLNAALDSTNPRPAGWHKILLWIAIPLLIVCAIIAAILIMRKKHKGCKQETAVTDELNEDAANNKGLQKDDIYADLFKRIELLMDEEQLYLNPNLKASDVAAKIGSNTAYVSAAINTQRGCSFSQYIISYRIAYAQELMRKNPENKISSISAMSGFNTDSTFFRAFRAITGMSPKEWLSGLKEE